MTAFMQLRRGVVVAAVGLLAAACSPSPSPAPPQGGGEQTRAVTVFAAASLTAAFQSMGSAIGQVNPPLLAEYNFAGSPTLVAQIQQGAPVDVFASADQPNMQKLVDGGLVSGSPWVFATNRLQIVVAAGNPKGITGLADLVRPGLVVVLCAPAVPCGRYAAQALQKAGVRVVPASQETDVKAVVSKVALGEADAGIVYVTDVKAGGAKVQGIAIPDNQNVVATYPIAVVKGASHGRAAQAFVDFVLSAQGQRILASVGFGGP
jgi:molybdate transport system substrate-binding protein